MSDEPPTPPAGLPTDFVDALTDYSPNRLQRVARYAEKLAAYNTCEARLKEINDNRYYWQW